MSVNKNSLSESFKPPEKDNFDKRVKVCFKEKAWCDNIKMEKSSKIHKQHCQPRIYWSNCRSQQIEVPDIEVAFNH